MSRWVVSEILRCGAIPNHVAFIMDGNRRWAEQRCVYVCVCLYIYNFIGTEVDLSARPPPPFCTRQMIERALRA